MDDVHALRGMYAYLRGHASPSYQGVATLLWRKWHRPNPPSFLVYPNGDVLHVPSPRAGLLAEMRLLMLGQRYPVDFVAQWDRTDN